jgi:type I restriction enzyme, R subunit
MNESEWQTRKQRIDMRLRSISPAWKIVRYSDGLDLKSLHCHAVEELPTANGPADYGLFVGGKLLGIIEAKKVTVSPQNALEQAKRYAMGAFHGSGDWNGIQGPVPLCLERRADLGRERRFRKRFHPLASEPLELLTPCKEIKAS